MKLILIDKTRFFLYQYIIFTSGMYSIPLITRVKREEFLSLPYHFSNFIITILMDSSFYNYRGIYANI
jgi:hypothetical protein